MKALVTGATGFVGRHLTGELEDNGYEAIRANRIGRRAIRMNVLDYEEVRSALRYINPSVIFHLAAIAFVPTSWQNPALVFDVNAKGTINLLEAVKSLQIDPIIHLAGTSEEYGLVKESELPIDENQPFRPMSPYAVSKIAMDLLGYQYFESFGMKIIRTRAFNHEGYGRGEQYMPSSFAKQIAQIEKGKREPIIHHGDLTSKRDITDVRDVVRAYRMAAEMCKPGEVYNIGSGKVYSAREVLNTLLSLSVFKGKIKKEKDPTRMRPSDIKILHCDNTKFKKATKWEPKYDIKETLSEVLRFWRERG